MKFLGSKSYENSAMSIECCVYQVRSIKVRSIKRKKGMLHNFLRGAVWDLGFVIWEIVTFSARKHRVDEIKTRKTFVISVPRFE